MIGRIAVVTVILATPSMAQEHRELGAHEHGVGQLDIAIEGERVSLELHAPGADIVGFEHHAESAEDRAAVDDAVAILARPLALFVLPAAAECSVVEASAELEAEGHDEHDAHEEYEDEHAEADGHENEEGGHTEFHAEYALDCAQPSAIERIEFAYFETFPNAREIELQLVTDTGAKAFEIERDTPVLDLAGQI
ncbi:DUF2796 domain-containing protein [Sedimentitalea sp. HM32M-2]|uniref:DUF2796 domain-containing protein n=1 Tax=Sedimentitalea sp. HM32M-2 TaxID=3351566 RepID=UPI00362517A6